MANHPDVRQGRRVPDSLGGIPICQTGIHQIATSDRNNLLAIAKRLGRRLTQTAYNSRRCWMFDVERWTFSPMRLETSNIQHSTSDVQSEKNERVKGIEPSCVAWEATVLPLNYTRERVSDFRFQIADCNRNKITATKSRRRH